MRRATAIALLLAGCGGPVGIDLRLVADPNVNLESQVLDALDSIVLVVDSPEGLYAPGEERTGDGAQIENADSDPALEVVATVPVTSDRLPVIRLEQGSLPDASLELRLVGVPAAVGAEPTAVGRVQAARLSQPPEELAVPFNLVPELLPPRVVEVLPGEGDDAPGCAVPSILLMFSAPIDEASLTGAITLSAGRVTEVLVDPSGRTAQLTVEGLGSDPPTLTYRLRLAPTVVGRDGRPLDQVPSEEGAQPLDVEVELRCAPGMATPENPCATAPPATMGTCPYPDRFACVSNRCVPSSCDGERCGDNEACDPSTGYCELDCRLWGDAQVCPAARPTCDATGVCR